MEMNQEEATKPPGVVGWLHGKYCRISELVGRNNLGLVGSRVST
jgi:hypothetical protein